MTEPLNSSYEFDFDDKLPLWLPIDPFFDAVKRHIPSVGRPIEGKSLKTPEKRWRADDGDGVPWCASPEEVSQRGQATCLDYCPQSETHPSTRHKTAKVANRMRIFPSGELEVRTVSRGSTAKPPPRAYGRRMSRGVSGNGRRVIRRAVSGLVAAEPCQVALYTLSSQREMSDDEWNKYLHSFLAWGRKYLGPYFKHYVCVNQLQARGTLHAHLLLFKRIPKGLWRRMRDLWAVKYEMGPGSFDVKAKIRSASRAAAYMTRYLTGGKESVYRLGLDAEGMLSFEPWAVGRNGEPYKRMKFSGNAYRVSEALRYYLRPVAEYYLPWGSHLALLCAVTLRGGIKFFSSPSDAKKWVSSNLAAAP